MNPKLLALLVSISLASPAGAQISALSQLGSESGESVEAVQKAFEKTRVLAEESKALFKLGEKDGRRLLEIRANQLGVNYMFAATVDRGTGEKGVYSAMMDDTFVWYFRLAEKDRVQFMRRNLAQRAAPGTPEAKAIAESYQDSLVATLPIVSRDTTTATVSVDARDLFLKDFGSLAAKLEKAYGKQMRLSDMDSVLGAVKVFPKNMEIDVQLQFAGAGEVRSTLPDSRLAAITMHYSLLALPDSPGFQTRTTDERVGYFEASYRDLTNKDLKQKLDPAVRLINRWHLEKTDPTAPVSDVKNPIVYWLDSTVPHEYRPAVRSGILAWNAAFEQAGLRNAIVVKEVDKDMPAAEREVFDPANASYNVVRWFMGEKSAMGEAPSRVSPLTGEIFNASLRLGDQYSRLLQDMTAIAVPGNTPAGHEHARGCGHWQSLKNSAAALALAEAKGPLTAEDRGRFQNELMTELAAHEIGHTLGLRHNFAGGTLHPLEEVGKDGLISSSLMHYSPANLAPKGRPQGPYFQTQVGPYDRWAIEYGYRPEASAAELVAIAARADTDPRLKYCTDEDLGTSPDCQQHFLGRDVVAFARQRTALADDLIKRQETLKDGGKDAYAGLRRNVGAGLHTYSTALDAVLPAIGGVRTSRTGRPYEAVSAAEQRAALKFLDEKIFSAEPFKISPELLQRMGEERKEYRGTAPYPLAETVLGIQKSALDHIYDPKTLGRLSDSTLFGQTAITPGETMMTVRRSIWKEIESPKAVSVDLLRRELQREHLKRLVGLLDEAKAPGDARAQARRDLEAIARNAARAAAAKGLDDASSAHLEDMRRLAVEALKTGKGPSIS